MSVEKAFAIRAAPGAIYAALERDLAAAAAEGGSFRVLHRDPPRSLDLAVTIGSFPCSLRYELHPREHDTEVSARAVPSGYKYLLFRMVTLGLHDGGIAVALVVGLTNLKQAVEDGQRDEAAP